MCHVYSFTNKQINKQTHKQKTEEKIKKLFKIQIGEHYQTFPFFYLINLFIVVSSGNFHCKILNL